MTKQTSNKQTQDALNHRIQKMTKAQLRSALESMLACWERVPRRYRTAAVKLHKDTTTKTQLLAQADTRRLVDEQLESQTTFQLDDRDGRL